MPQHKAGLTPCFKHQRNPEIDVRNGEEHWVPRLNTRRGLFSSAATTRRILKCSLQHEWRSQFIEKTQRVPQIPTPTPRGPYASHHHSTKTSKFSLTLDEPFTLQHSKEIPHSLLEHERYLPPFMKLQNFPEILVPTREEC